RVIFNEEVQRALVDSIGAEATKDVPFINEALTKRVMDDFITGLVQRYGATQIASVLDTLKTLGFEYATTGGITISKNDIVVPESKEEILQGYEERDQKVEAQYESGLITPEERHEMITEI